MPNDYGRNDGDEGKHGYSFHAMDIFTKGSEATPRSTEAIEVSSACVLLAAMDCIIFFVYKYTN